MTILYVLILLFTAIRQNLCFNAVGWYLGDYDGVSSIPFDTYTHIVTGFPKMYDNGTIVCDKTDNVTMKIIDIAHDNDVYVQWRTPYIFDFNKNNDYKRTNFLNSIRSAVEDCNIDGFEYDFEWTNTRWGWGLVSKWAANRYTNFLKSMKVAMGGDKIVSADVGVWGFPGGYPLEFLPWINVTMLNNGDIDFINTMSYHWDRTGDIWQWGQDIVVMRDIWGIDLSRVNLGVPYFSMNYSGFKVSNEPTWGTLSNICPDVAPDVNVCDNIPFVGKLMNRQIGQLARDNEMGGVFPWAMSYDDYHNNNTLIYWLLGTD